MANTITFVIRIISIFSLISLFILSVQGSTPKGSLQKESKRLVKQLKEEGWKVFGSGKTIKEALDAHYQMLMDSNGSLTTIEGNAKTKNINLAIRKIQNQAALQYASMKEAKVEGVTEIRLNNSQGDDVVSNNEFSTNFKSSTEQTVKSLIPTVILYRILSDGWVEVRAFFLIDTLK